VHALPAPLSDLTEILSLGVRRRGAQLLLELASCRGERIRTVGLLPFGDRPGAGVPLRPRRTTRVDEQHFEPVAVLAV